MAVSPFDLGLLGAILVLFSFVAYLYTGRMKGFRDTIIIFDVIILLIVLVLGFLNLDDATAAVIYLTAPGVGLLLLGIRFNRNVKGPYHKMMATNNRILENHDLSLSQTAELSFQSELDLVKSQQDMIVERIANIIRSVKEKDNSLQSNIYELSNQTKKMDDETKEISRDIDQILQSALELREKIDSMVEASIIFTDKLEADFEILTEIVHSTDRIADQTNLIAVNAAIEASHSKSQSNFETVADAIQDLSHRMRDNTDRLRTHVTEVKRDITDDVDQVSKELDNLDTIAEKISGTSTSSSQLIHQQVIHIHQLSSIIEDTVELNKTLDNLLDQYKVE